MTAVEVSRFLKIPLSTLYGLTKRGKIKGIKVGKHWRYLEQDVYGYFSGSNHSQPSFNRSVKPSYFSLTSAKKEKRIKPRINCELPAHLFNLLHRREEPGKTGALYNLSISGAYFVNGGCADKFEIGDPVKLTFQLPQSERVQSIEFEGRVVHKNNTEYGIGVKFKAVRKEEEEVLKRYVG